LLYPKITVSFILIINLNISHRLDLDFFSCAIRCEQAQFNVVFPGQKEMDRVVGVEATNSANWMLSRLADHRIKKYCSNPTQSIILLGLGIRLIITVTELE
jgi:hypothetical protein